MSKEQLSLVKTVTTMGGLIPDQQAKAVDTMLWGFIKLGDPDAIEIAEVSMNKPHGTLPKRSDLLADAVEQIMAASNRKGVTLSKAEISRAAIKVVEAVIIKKPSGADLGRVMTSEIRAYMKEVA